MAAVMSGGPQDEIPEADHGGARACCRFRRRSRVGHRLPSAAAPATETPARADVVDQAFVAGDERNRPVAGVTPGLASSTRDHRPSRTALRPVRAARVADHPRSDRAQAPSGAVGHYARNPHRRTRSAGLTSAWCVDHRHVTLAALLDNQRRSVVVGPAALSLCTWPRPRAGRGAGVAAPTRRSLWTESRVRRWSTLATWTPPRPGPREATPVPGRTWTPAELDEHLVAALTRSAGWRISLPAMIVLLERTDATSCFAAGGNA